MKILGILVILTGILVGHISAAVIKEPLSQLYPTPTITPSPTPFIRGTPTKLVIPTINLETTVESVGLDSEGRMDIPKQINNVAWYSPGVKPGELGSAVINGHVDTPQGKPAVFANIENLKIDDTIKVEYTSGESQTFVVTDVQSYSLETMPLEAIFNKKDGSYLNLITCDGEWNRSKKTYSHRLVVFAKKTN